jgi:antitoxin component of MazEF toxin-antitoxin module
MRPTELMLARLRDARITVEVDGSDLVLEPGERLTAELTAQVRAFKAQIIRELTWDDAEADRLLDAALERIGRACTELESFDTDQRRVDLEERINVAGWRRDWPDYQAALAAYERHCLSVYGAGPRP